jgi:hypothetical protein
MKTKYQIFVSSTYEDLKEERDLVIKAVLEMGHIPVGMEMFSAGDEEQWKLIKRQIEDCDYYVVIVAFRYGSLAVDFSYTEMEYDYAVSLGIPTLGFIITDGVQWPSGKIDKDSQKVTKLNMFKEKVKSRIVSFWSEKNDLYGKVSIALMKQFNTSPRIGWVRANEHAGPEILKEISRLSNENSVLRKEIESFNINSRIEEQDKINKVIAILKHNKRPLSFFYKNGREWEDKREVSLGQIFITIAPEMMIEYSSKNCAKFIGLIFKPNKQREIRDNWGTASNTVRQIFADLNILELILHLAKNIKLTTIMNIGH